MKIDMSGEMTPTDPHETANRIYDIIDRKIEITSKHVFINYKGKPISI